MKSRFGKRITAGAIGLGLLFVVAASSQADPTNYWWTGSAGNGVWENSGNWVLTNATSDGGLYPGVVGAGENTDGDYASFTNSGTYSVSINSGDDISTSSNIFSCATGIVSTATITLTLNGTAKFAPYVSNPDTGIVVGQGSNETTVVYLASAPSPNGLQMGAGNADVGHDGIGTLIITNGYVAAHNLNIGSGIGRGTVIISGPNTYWHGYQISIANTNASYGNTLVVSNSASLALDSTFRIGSSSSQASSNCLFVVANGGFVSVNGGAPVTVGNRATVTGSEADYNMAIIANGGIWDNTNHSLVVGAACAPVCQIVPCSACAGGYTYATGNVFQVQAGGLGYGFSQVCITPSNTFQLYGGTFGGMNHGYLTSTASPIGDITNYGVFEGWGVIVGSLNTASNTDHSFDTGGGLGFTAVSNQVGALVVSNGFSLATNCVLQIALGTNYYPIVVGLGQTEPQTNSSPALTNNLALNGTINFVDSGGFTAPHTYPLITYPSSVLGNYNNGTLYYLNTFSCAPTIGTKPNNSYTYTITNNAAAGEIDLVVGCPSCPPPVATITSITRINSGVDGNNDILLQWNTNGATNNHVQATTGTANGSYSASGFASLANIVVTTATTNYVDVGGWTNTTTHSRYYRISSP